jgi:hypothetical protein
MIVLAIDPGYEKSAWLEYDTLGQCIRRRGIDPNVDILGWIDISFADHLAIEMVESFGMAVGKEVFETVFWIGRFVEAFFRGSNKVGKVGKAGKPFTLVYRKDVKMHICHSPWAKDSNIRRALLDRFGGPLAMGTKKSPGPLHGISKDLWSALAIAITFAEGAAERKKDVTESQAAKAGTEVGGIYGKEERAKQEVAAPQGARPRRARSSG